MNVFSLVGSPRNNPQRGADLTRIMENLRDQAATELRDAIAGASVKRIRNAGIPGVSAFGLSRSVNGCPSNVLYRIASIYMLLHKLGFPRARVQRLIDWQQMVLDWIYGPEGEDGRAGESATSPRGVVNPPRDHGTPDSPTLERQRNG